MEIGKPQRVDEVPEPSHQPIEFEPPVPEKVPAEEPAVPLPVPAEPEPVPAGR